MFSFENVDYVDSSDKLTAVPEIFELNVRCIHNQKQAAEFCGVTTRTLQRWNAQGLNNIQYKNQVLYDEDDLVAFMEEIGHHPGMQRVGKYGHKIKK